jgi:hypothetical protein
VKLKTTTNQRAPKDSTTFVSKYLNEMIDYGGSPLTRSEVILDMQRDGCSQAMIDRWFQGYELAQRIQLRCQRLQVKLHLGAK